VRNRELTGRFLGEKAVFGEGERRCIIGKIRAGKDEHTVRGYAPEGELQSGMMFRFYGHVHVHPRYGEQFNFNSFTPEKPADDESIVAYLKQCHGPQKGSITEQVALALVETFGADAISAVIDAPAKAAEAIKRFGTRWDAEKAMVASLVLRASESIRATKVELIGLLDGRGFPKKTPDRCIKAMGVTAATTVKQNPYSLMCLPGIGFKGADKMYCDIARKRCKTTEEYQQALALIERQGRCADYAVRTDRTGSTWVPRNVAEMAVRQNVSNTLAKPDNAISWAKGKGYLESRTSNGEWIAVKSHADSEVEVAQAVNDLLARDDLGWPELNDKSDGFEKLTDHQFEQLRNSLQRRIGILRGSPGVGKTFTIAALVKWLLWFYGEDCVAIACPTGKAAVRATQAMVAAGVSIAATTIHRLLIVAKGEEEGWSFYYGEQQPMPYRFIIIDESSMIDTGLMASLLRACSEDTHILLTGDGNQLSPVGHGLPFVNLQSVVPTGSLTEIHRNSGRIVRACAEIRDTNQFRPSDSYNEAEGENLPWIECKEDDLQVSVLNLVQQIERGGECDPIWDVQVLTACNNNTPVSRQLLNPKLQDLLNPHGKKHQGNPFRVGDKIVCLKNGGYWLTPGFAASLSGRKCYEVGDDRVYQMEDGQTLRVSGDDNEVYVANGELGEILEIEPAKMIVRLFDPAREVTVPYQPVREDEVGVSDDVESKGAVGDWDLGYVLSVHKSQGSAWPYVVAIIDPSSRASNVMTRNWIYTAISRASRATFCIGKMTAAQAACRRDGLAGRKTFLVESILADKARKSGLLERLTETV